jgi:hypothetical protein
MASFTHSGVIFHGSEYIGISIVLQKARVRCDHLVPPPEKRPRHHVEGLDAPVAHEDVIVRGIHILSQLLRKSEEAVLVRVQGVFPLLDRVAEGLLNRRSG